MSSEKKPTKGKMIRNSNDLELLRDIINAHPTMKMRVMDVIRQTLGIKEVDERTAKRRKREENED